MTTEERVLWTGRPAMFRNAPISFLFALFLVPVGIGIVILLLWWLRCLGTTWTVTPTRTILRRGILSKATVELRHVDIRAIHLEQGMFQRLMGTGNVHLSSASSADFEITISGVTNPGEVTSLMRSLQERRDATGQSFAPTPVAMPAAFPSPQAPSGTPYVATSPLVPWTPQPIEVPRAEAPADRISHPSNDEGLREQKKVPAVSLDQVILVGAVSAFILFAIVFVWFSPWLSLLTSLVLLGIGAYSVVPATFRGKLKQSLRLDIDDAKMAKVAMRVGLGGVVLILFTLARFQIGGHRDDPGRSQQLASVGREHSAKASSGGPPAMGSSKVAGPPGSSQLPAAAISPTPPREPVKEVPKPSPTGLSPKPMPPDNAGTEKPAPTATKPTATKTPQLPDSVQTPKEDPVTIEWRNWTSKDGKFTTEAKFIKFEDGKVHLEKRDGKAIAVNPSVLSEEDQKYVAGRIAEQKTSGEKKFVAPTSP